MIRPRLGVRAIGLCLALAGLMVVGAGSAQAEVGAKWLVEGKAVTNALKAELSGTLEGNHGVLLGEIGGKGIHILCTGVTFVAGGTLLVEGGLLGKVQFSGCKILQLTVLNGATAALGACTPAGGLITSNLSKGLLRLHLSLFTEIIEGKEVTLDLGLETVTVLEAEEGTLFTTITTGPECAFGEQIKINGKLALVDIFVGVTKFTHLITEFGPLTELYINGNKANRATIDGSANIKLAGAHAGLSWSGDPA